MVNTLTKEIKDKISDVLVATQSDVSNLKIEIGKLLYKTGMLALPFEVQTVMTLYPKYFDQLTNFIWIGNYIIYYLDSEGKRVSLPCIFSRDSRQYIDIKESNLPTQVTKNLSYLNDKLIPKFHSSIKDNEQLKRQIDCILKFITTPTMLAQEFPEAYNVYIELQSKNIATNCDSIEKVRAILSKGSVKTKKFK